MWGRSAEQAERNSVAPSSAELAADTAAAVELLPSERRKLPLRKFFRLKAHRLQAFARPKSNSYTPLTIGVIGEEVDAYTGVAAAVNIGLIDNGVKISVNDLRSLLA